MVEPTQEDSDEVEAEETKPEIGHGIEFSPDGLADLFQKLFDENPENAINTMRENLEEAVADERATPEFQRILNEILDDVEKAPPEQQAQTFKDAVEDSTELKDEAANVLLLMDAADDQTSSLLKSGGPFAILFAVLSMVAGAGNTDFMSAMKDVMEELGVDTKPIEEALAAAQEAPEQATPPANRAEAPAEQPAAVAGESTPATEADAPAQPAEVVGAAQEEQVDPDPAAALADFDFSGDDSEYQGDEAIRVDALAALDNAGVPVAGISGLEQGGMPTEQLEETATINLAVPS